MASVVSRDLTRQRRYDQESDAEIQGNEFIAYIPAAVEAISKIHSFTIAWPCVLAANENDTTDRDQDVVDFYTTTRRTQNLKLTPTRIRALKTHPHGPNRKLN